MNKENLNDVNVVDIIDDIDDEEFEKIVEGWDPSLKGYSIKWNFDKKKWIIIK